MDDIVARVKTAVGARAGIEAAIHRYIERGYQHGAPPYDSWDLFAISSLVIPEKVGCCGLEPEQMVEAFGRIFKRGAGWMSG